MPAQPPPSVRPTPEQAQNIWGAHEVSPCREPRLRGYSILRCTFASVRFVWRVMAGPQSRLIDAVEACPHGCQFPTTQSRRSMKSAAIRFTLLVLLAPCAASAQPNEPRPSPTVVAASADPAVPGGRVRRGRRARCARTRRRAIPTSPHPADPRARPGRAAVQSPRRCRELAEEGERAATRRYRSQGHARRGLLPPRRFRDGGGGVEWRRSPLRIALIVSRRYPTLNVAVAA